MDSEAILWDVVEEHLDEAEFLAETWHTNLDSPAYLREEFAAGPQERLLAHVDGLVIGDEPVRAELLEPALADEETERWRACAAAMALLDAPSAQVGAALFMDLHERPEEVRAGIVDALAMSARPDIDVRITDALRKGGEPGQLATLAGLGGRRGVNPANLVDDLLKDGDDQARAAAVSMLPFGDRRYLSWVEHSLAATEPVLARAAARAGLIMGSGPAWQQVGRAALAADPDPEYLVWVASLCDARIVEQMVERMDEVATRPVFVHALGYSGRRSAMEACLRWLGDEACGPLAGEAFASMTGLPLEDDTYWDDVEEADEPDEDLEAEVEDDEPDDDLSLTAEQELRIPKPEAIAQWWAEHQARFNPKQRYIAGRPADQGAVGHALAVLPMRRLHALAYELLVRSRGQVHLRTRALTAASDDALAALPGLPRIDGNRSFGQH